MQHNHNIISIIRYKHSEPKLFLTEEIEVAANSDDPNCLPYSCEFFDFCRLLVVKTNNGNILGYRIPEPTLDIDKHLKTDSIPLEEDQIKKILKYPINMATFEKPPERINEPKFCIEFKGEKVALKYKDIKAMMSRKKAPPPEEAAKKDPKKK